MRCILIKGVEYSVSSRIKYFMEAIHLWMIPFSLENGSIELRSIPSSCEDICFIIGHRNDLRKYLEKNKPTENIVVLITCIVRNNFVMRYLSGKKVYISHQTNGYSDTYDGKAYGFDFDITESELIFYNNRRKESIIERLESAFTRISG